jgi:hypothetical protein
MQELDSWLMISWPWYVGALVLLLVLAVVPELIRRYRHDADERRIQKVFKDANATFRKDVAFPDGMEGYVFVDYLVLTPNGVVVMDMQDYNGFIFGAANIDHWTQMVRRRGYKFENPLHQNSWRVQVIKSLVKEAPVIGRVLFSSASQFPKGLPEGVSHVSTLSTDVTRLFENKAVSDALRGEWEQLLAIAIDAKSPNWHKPAK